MSFLQRIQPFLLSGFLATTATSCPPDRFFSSNPLENDPDDRVTCPVRSLPPLTDGPDGVGRTLAGLAGLGIDPDSFHLENLDRFRPLEPLCSAPQIGRFDGLQEMIADRIAAMPAAEIAGALESLYAQAYVYNEADRTMPAGDSPAHREAKRRLDLWIAAIDQKAFGDRSFFDRIWGEKRIRTTMTLNSPRLLAYDRGVIEEMFRAESRGDEGLRELANRKPMESYTRLFDWVRTYDGRSEKYFETPFMRSMTDSGIALESHFGRERLLRLSHDTFPREGVERLMEERGYGADYRRYQSMEREELIQHYLEVSMIPTPESRPASRRRAVEQLFIMGTVFDQRGSDPMHELELRLIEQMVRNGFLREDAELMIRLQTGMAPNTYDRLDDYRGRHGLLDEYRSLYRDMLTHPLEDVFSRENLGRYSAWGAIILNRSMSKIPIFLDDLDAVRADVQNEVLPTMHFGTETGPFEFRDRETPQWFTASDLGLCQSLTGGPMSTAGVAYFNGRTAEDLICSNVELMAFLPESLHLDHALATAIGVFGVITMRSRNEVSDDGVHARNEEWTPASLVDTVTHEASHVDWFRSNFDRNPQRLPMITLNERQAYLTGRGFQADYFLSGFGQPGEAAQVERQARFEEEVVQAANDTLGIPADQTDPDYWDPHWDTEPLIRFAAQPPAILGNRRFRQMMDARFGPPTTDFLDQTWSRIFDNTLNLLPAEDRGAARVGLAQIESPSNTADGAVFFLKSDAFMRAVNEIRAAAGVPPLLSIDMEPGQWATSRREMTLWLVDRVRSQSLQPPAARPVPPHRSRRPTSR